LSVGDETAGVEAPVTTSLIGSALRTRLLRGSAWVTLGKGAAAAVRLVIGAMLARLLAPSELGAYFIMFTLVYLFATLGGLGLNQTVVRLVAEEMAVDRPDRARAAVRMSVVGTGIGTAVVAGLVAVGGGRIIATDVFGSPTLAASMGPAAAWIATIALCSVLAETFRGFHDIRLATAFDGLAGSAFGAALLVAVWALRGRASLAEVTWLTAIGGALSVVVAALLLRRRVDPLPRGGTYPVRPIAAIAWPILVTNLVLFAVGKASDLWIIGGFRSSTDAALYGAVLPFLTLIDVPLLILAGVVPPIVAELNARGERARLEQTLRFTTSLAAIPSLLMTVVLAAGGSFILTLVYGNSFYGKAATLLAILAAAQFANVFAGPCGIVLMLTGHQRAMMMVTICCGVLSVALGIAAVGPFGPVGVAVGTSIGLVLQNVLMLIMVRRRLGIWTSAYVSPAMVFRLLRSPT
jgi:O-antigen/teichoic acid export membrane protein